MTGSVIWSTVRAIRGAEPAAGTVASVAARTGIAERAVVKLPDGSEVQLGPASSLETRSGFGQGARDVELTGEAVFTVTHDASRPFRVHSGEAVIEDLGTRFVVRAVMDEPLRVAVSEGSVSIGRADSPRARHAVLNPRDVAVLGSTGDAVVTRGVDVERYSTWAGERAELVFDNVPLRAVFRELERWYDVRFDVTDASVLDRTFTAPVTGLSIDAVLQVMSTALALPFEREGKVVRLSPPVRTGLAVQEGAQVGGGA
ncbi:MAG: FecR domain-containing protein [Gemmatimonadaceae bacterium]|nr:FecR domain-containing protein [Gemmatimonadaceae bacterium]